MNWNARWQAAQDLLSGDVESDRVVPPDGFTAALTGFSAFVMAFVAVFALALSVATGRLAERWSNELAQTSTVRISAPDKNQMNIQTKRVLEILSTTPGIEDARLMDQSEQRKLLEPWFGPDLPLDNLPVPNLVELAETVEGPDVDGLRLRLQAEAPGAVLDDHSRWRGPLIEGASRLRLISTIILVLSGAALFSIIVLAAQAALAANGQVISVLQLVGAKDSYIAKAFVRRFTIRAFLGAALGTLFAMLIVILLPAPAEEGAFLSGLGFSGLEWLRPLLIPLITALIAFWATRIASFRALRKT